jgi:hypothetical protein
MSDAQPLSHSGGSRGEEWVIAQLLLLAAIGIVPRRLGNLPPWSDALARCGRALSPEHVEQSSPSLGAVP